MGDVSQGEGPVKPRNPWRRFRALPRWVQITSWIAAILVVGWSVGAATGEDTATSNQVATATTSTSVTTAAPTTTTSTSTTTTTSTSTTTTTSTSTTTSTTSTTTTTTTAPAVGSALAGLATLSVKGRAPKTGYSREQFGAAWSDDVSVPDGHNGCDTRNDILRRDLTDITFKAGTGGCTVLSGILHDPYTNTTIRFMRGVTTSQEVQIDHVVALGDAWQKGAQQLTMAARVDLANDPLNLLAVSGWTNEQKGDSDAASWLPPNRAFRCPYVARQVAVKIRYHLWVTSAEGDAMRRVLSTCPSQTLPAEAGPPPPLGPGPSAPQPSTTVAPPRPAPTTPPTTTAPSPRGSLPTVHPGAYCTPPGARGVTTKGTPMVCKLDSKGVRYRWGAA